MAKKNVGTAPSSPNDVVTKGYIDGKLLGGINDFAFITTAAYAALVAAGTTVPGRVYFQVG